MKGLGRVSLIRRHNLVLHSTLFFTWCHSMSRDRGHCQPVNRLVGRPGTTASSHIVGAESQRRLWCCGCPITCCSRSKTYQHRWTESIACAAFMHQGGGLSSRCSPDTSDAPTRASWRISRHMPVFCHRMWGGLYKAPASVQRYECLHQQIDSFKPSFISCIFLFLSLSMQMLCLTSYWGIECQSTSL